MGTILVNVRLDLGRKHVAYIPYSFKHKIIRRRDFGTQSSHMNIYSPAASIEIIFPNGGK